MEDLSKLCRVAQAPNGYIIGPGTFLATSGAWDNKHVIEYFELMEIETLSNGCEYHVFAVGMRFLGHIFADGRVQPAVRKITKEQRWRLYVENPDGPVTYSRNWGDHQTGRNIPVIPVDKPLKTKDVVVQHIPSPYKQAVAKSPEAVLADFKV